jgi:hypothetical protein
VRAEIVGQKATILAHTDAHRAGRQAARARYADVSEALRRPEQRARRAGRFALIITAVAAVGSVAIALHRHDAWWLAACPGVGLYAGYMPWWLLTLWRDIQRAKHKAAEREQERDLAEARYHSVLLNEVTAAVRRAVNDRLRSASTEFVIYDIRGLQELADPEREVPTASTEQLSKLMSSLTGGSLGLSGPRGSGKTTLMRSFATGRSLLPFDRERRGLVVAAPVHYDAKEFVLHLYASVCERILNPQGARQPAASRANQLRVARSAGLGQLLLGLTILFAAVGMTMLVSNRTSPHGPQETGVLLLVLAGIALYVGGILMLASNPDRVRRVAQGARGMWVLGAKAATDGEHPAPKPEWLAEQRLEEIRFQQTLASGWSGAVGLPLGTKLAAESKLTSARAPWTLPEIVANFRDFAGMVTEHYYLVIGIDEMDKMESDESARQFLNNIKGVFGVRGCYYLVSVSEDAMSSFERRGLPFRDVFDSSFDAIQRVGYLDLAASRDVLESRVTGLPVPYQCLCHCLAGGLPRDLIRVARELVYRQRDSGETSLRELCSDVVSAELRGKAVAAAVTARSVAGREREWVLSWLQRQDIERSKSHMLLDRYNELVSSAALSLDADASKADWRLRQIVLEVAAYGYYAATLLDFFGDEHRVRGFLASPTSANELRQQAVAAVEKLAIARQQFTLSPWLALSDISSFREQLAWLRPWPGLIDDRPSIN